MEFKDFMIDSNPALEGTNLTILKTFGPAFMALRDNYKKAKIAYKNAKFDDCKKYCNDAKTSANALIKEINAIPGSKLATVLSYVITAITTFSVSMSGVALDIPINAAINPYTPMKDIAKGTLALDAKIAAFFTALGVSTDLLVAVLNKKIENAKDLNTVRGACVSFIKSLIYDLDELVAKCK